MHSVPIPKSFMLLWINKVLHGYEAASHICTIELKLKHTITRML